MVLVFSWVVLSPPRTRVHGTNEMGSGKGMGGSEEPQGRSSCPGQRAGTPWTSSPALQRFPRPLCKQTHTSRDLLRLGSGDMGTLNISLCWRFGQREANWVRSEWPLSGMVPGEARGGQWSPGWGQMLLRHTDILRRPEGTAMTKSRGCAHLPVLPKEHACSPGWPSDRSTQSWHHRTCTSEKKVSPQVTFRNRYFKTQNWWW